jgi:hypothetical protein
MGWALRGSWVGLAGAITALILSVLASVASAASWSVQPTPNPSSAPVSSLTSVSCSSADACTAVGYVVTSSGAYQTLAERWDGSAWSIQSTPNPSAENSQLSAVSCHSDAACTAVGEYATGTHPFVPLVETWDGTQWTAHRVHNPDRTMEAELNGVSCVPSGMCMAVGDYDNSHLVFAERWNGTSWSLERPPNPPGARFAVMSAVSCRTSRQCTAVGEIGNDAGLEVSGLAEGWTRDAGWSLETAPNPSGSAGYLFGVSCRTLTVCTAVGSAYGHSRSSILAERSDGTAWATETTPSRSYRLTGVSCSFLNVCAAVGFDLRPLTVPLALFEHGSRWVVDSPEVVGSQSDLTSISCTAQTVCTAVGFYIGADSRTLSLAERYG